MQERRLAAIMFSDIVGYTTLMGSDEDKAFQVLRQNRDIQQSLINKYNGGWLKEMGDGILAQFSSATDSVLCAIEIQRQARKELGAQIRIGIHLGDVTFENKDVFGDGVNIASRLQSIADPGGIYISESVHNAIRSRNDIATQYLGEVKLKNVNYLFKTYYIKEKGLPVPSKNRINELIGTKKTESIVVLPFDNYTGSDELEYFVAGMHSSLIGAIGKISAMRVISKTTSNAYKDTEKSIPEIASELGVNTVIEASVLSLGEKICLQVKLVDAYPEEKQLWVQDYYEEKSQILNLYNTVTKEIFNEINVILTPEEEVMLAESKTVDNEAYDLYMKGQFYLDQITDESLRKAADYFSKAIEIDPNWAPLHAGLAEVGIYQMQMGFLSPSIAIPRIYENLNKALELDPNSANSHYMKGVIAVWTEWNWEKGEKEFKRALELNPNKALCRMFYAHLLYILQRSDEALYQANMALELDPMRPFILGLSASVLFEVGDFQSAMKYSEKALSIDPENHFANYALESLHYLIGDFQKSIEMLTQHPFIEENIRSAMKKAFKEQGYTAAFEIYIGVKEEIAIEGFMEPYLMAYDYMRVKKYDKVLDWLEQGYEIHSPMMPYIGIDFRSDELNNHPRYIELLKKMNLPLP
jgi:class 3 adenylate cyclase/Tfp pilus assembly protein PilF